MRDEDEEKNLFLKRENPNETFEWIRMICTVHRHSSCNTKHTYHIVALLQMYAIFIRNTFYSMFHRSHKCIHRIYMNINCRCSSTTTTSTIAQYNPTIRCFAFNKNCILRSVISFSKFAIAYSFNSRIERERETFLLFLFQTYRNRRRQQKKNTQHIFVLCFRIIYWRLCTERKAKRKGIFFYFSIKFFFRFVHFISSLFKIYIDCISIYCDATTKKKRFDFIFFISIHFRNILLFGKIWIFHGFKMILSGLVMVR